MSHNPTRVVVDPANYLSYPGDLNHPHDFFADEQLSRAMWIYGERVIVAAQAKLPPMLELPGVKHILLCGHCSGSDVRQLAVGSDDDRNVMIGAGDGALLDTAKTLARRLGLPLVTVLTVAVTCAAWTPLSIWYSDAGQVLYYEIFDDANFMVLAGPETILSTPQQYLLVGVGDTLAKWYEVVMLAPQPETSPLTAQLGISNVRTIRDVLLSSSEQAPSDQQNYQLTRSLCDVVDATIAGGGMVGGLGDCFTRVAAAHTVHGGPTMLLQTEKFFHGTKVAYGIPIQNALLGQDDVLVQLTGAYQRLHLPITLTELEVNINNQTEVDKVIAHALRLVESIRYLSVTLTPDTLRVAFGKVESFRA